MIFYMAYIYIQRQSGTYEWSARSLFIACFKQILPVYIIAEKCERASSLSGWEIVPPLLIRKFTVKKTILSISNWLSLLFSSLLPPLTQSCAIHFKRCPNLNRHRNEWDGMLASKSVQTHTSTVDNTINIDIVHVYTGTEVVASKSQCNRRKTYSVKIQTNNIVVFAFPIVVPFESDRFTCKSQNETTVCAFSRDETKLCWSRFFSSIIWTCLCRTRENTVSTVRKNSYRLFDTFAFVMHIVLGAMPIAGDRFGRYRRRHETNEWKCRTPRNWSLLIDYRLHQYPPNQFERCGSHENTSSSIHAVLILSGIYSLQILISIRYELILFCFKNNFCLRKRNWKIFCVNFFLLFEIGNISKKKNIIFLWWIFCSKILSFRVFFYYFSQTISDLL